MKFTFGSLFAGIGGIDLGLERAGWTCKWQVEIDPYCQAVLKKHWPNVPKYDDVKNLKGGELDYVDLICGGFPCQPVSVAGKKKAQTDERWLWPEFARIVRMVRPQFVLVENVPGILSANTGRAMGEVLGDLAESGYDAEWNCISAASIGAPHLRKRIFVVAYPNGVRGGREYWRLESREPKGDLSSAPTGNGSQMVRNGMVAHSDSRRRQILAKFDREETRKLETSQRYNADRRGNIVSNTDKPRVERPKESRYFGTKGQIALKLTFRHNTSDGGNWIVEPNVGRVASRIPARVDRLRTLGNAVVPQVSEYVGKRIREMIES